MSDLKKTKKPRKSMVIDSDDEKVVTVVSGKPDLVATYEDIQTLDRFLKLYDYNVTNLHVNKIAHNNLKKPLTELNKMIGMHKLKQEILVMALYYLKNVPERFTEIMERRMSPKQMPTQNLIVIQPEPVEDSFIDDEEEEEMDLDDDEYNDMVEEDEMDPEEEEAMRAYVRVLTLAILSSGNVNLPPPPNAHVVEEQEPEESDPPTPKFPRTKRGRADKAKYEKEQRVKKAKLEEAAQKEAEEREQRKAERAAKIAETTRLMEETEKRVKMEKLEEDRIIEETVERLDMLHTVICGEPGTGKSHVAQYIGQIYAAFGFLQKDKFKKIGGVDLIAGYLGQTAIKTKEICENSLGGVLFLDEAYSIGSNSDGNSDDYGREAADTFTDFLTNHKHDFVMIIAGYEDQLNSRFFGLNSGLQRRFQWKFNTNKYSAVELKKIFLKMLGEQKMTLEEDIPVSWFQGHYDSFKNFGGSMESLLSKVKYAHISRSILLDDAHHNKINMRDMELGFLKFKEHNDAMSNDAPPFGMYF